MGEVNSILMQRIVKIDNKVRINLKYPVGFQDIIKIERTDEYFRLMIDPKGRYSLHRIKKEEATYKLCKVNKNLIGTKGVPFVVTHDGRTIRYHNPKIKSNDTLMLEISSQEIKDYIKFEPGNISIIIRGHNAGRIGLIINYKKHNGIEINYIKAYLIILNKIAILI